MLSIQNLSVVCGENKVIDDFSLTLQPGTLSVLMGPNGSGKSTLAYALMGHPRYTVTAGTVLFNTHELLSLPVEKRARCGLFLACQYLQEIPGVQVFTFLKEAHRMLTGQELSVAAFKELVYAALDAVKLDHSFAYRNLYEGFSGGEKKRLEIAQLLLFKPSVAILDEIDSGLDVDALQAVAEALSRARDDNPAMSILLITHYTRILKYLVPDTVHILKEGTLIASGDKYLAEHIEQKGYNGLLL
jgi:Fe-S cluster assembly ATP-binding protein